MTLRKNILAKEIFETLLLFRVDDFEEAKTHLDRQEALDVLFDFPVSHLRLEILVNLRLERSKITESMFEFLK